MLPKCILIEKIARRKGFVPIGGVFMKTWPSGKVWEFSLEGKNPIIRDIVGREIQTQDHGLTVTGLLFNA